MELKFSNDITTNISATIRNSVLEQIDQIVIEERKKRPKNLHYKINRSSIISILLAKHLGSMQND